MKKTTLGLALAASVLLFACNGEAPKAETPVDSTATEMPTPEENPLSKNGITLTPAGDHQSFSSPTLTLDSPGEGDAVVAGMNSFAFTVTGDDYQLGAQTEDAEATMCANSAKGQHIHFIVNNAPYKAHYDPAFEGELAEGNNVVLAFLSRSYHESIKSEGAAVVTQFTVGDGEDLDLSGEHLFYSRPKGKYIGDFTGKVLLDFYLVNTTIGADGNKVKATINGTDFLLDEWVPYAMEGLPMGENTVTLELVDNDGNPVSGAFNNSGERKFTLEAAPEGDAQ